MPNTSPLRVERQKVGYDDPIPMDADQSSGKEKHEDEDEEVEKPLSEDDTGGGEIFRERKKLGHLKTVATIECINVTSFEKSWRVLAKSKAAVIFFQ